MVRRLIIALCAIGVAVPAFAQGNGSVPSGQGPAITQVVGSTEAKLSPAKYPKFDSFTSDNPTCGNYLLARYSDPQPDANGIADSGLSLAPVWVRSKYAPAAASVPGSNAGFQTILTQTIDIPQAYRRTANVLVTWTIRVEAYGPGAYKVKNTLCSPWNGTAYESFPGGLVKSRITVNGQAKGQDISMTVPNASNASSVGISENDPPPPPPPPSRRSDPTITGSYLVKAGDFAGGVFPAQVTIAVQWLNDTPLIIATPANQHNLIVTLMPVGQQG